MEVAIVIASMVAVFLITQRWFWLTLFIVGAIASILAVIASVIHFQILAALGFLALAVICVWISSFIRE